MKFQVGDIILAIKKDKWQTRPPFTPYAEGTYNMDEYLSHYPLGVGKVYSIMWEGKLLLITTLKGEYDRAFDESELVLIERP
jgi:hypothetical protein